MADDKVTIAPKNEEISIFHSGINSTDPQKRIEAIKKLAKHPRAEIAEVLANFCNPKYEASPEVRHAAIQALAQMEEFVNLEPIIAALNDPENNVSVLAALTLGEVGDKDTIPVLTKFANEPGRDKALFDAAFHAVTRITERQSIEDTVPTKVSQKPAQQKRLQKT